MYGPSIVTNTTAHELGHCLNLLHNLQGGTAGDQCDDCNDNDDLFDCPLQGTSKE